MKKYILLASLFVSIISVAQVKVNPKVGLSYSRLTDGAANNVRMSFLAGFDLRFGDVVNFVPGLYFGNVGTDIDYTENSVAYKFDNSINTLQLRTLIGLNIINTKVLRIRAIAGPSVHFTVYSTDLEKEDINLAIAYFNAGFGVDFGILTIDLRYEYGLTGVFDKSGPETIAVDTKNNILILSAGFVF